MNVPRTGMNLLEEMNPLGWLVAGAAFVLAIPSVRRQLRPVAVLAIRGGLEAGDQLKKASQSLTVGFSELVHEARQQFTPGTDSVVDEGSSDLADFSTTSESEDSESIGQKDSTPSRETHHDSLEPPSIQYEPARF